MAYKFKEGIDWDLDATGNTPLANHYFISKDGNDTTGDGTISTPYLTLGYAVSIHRTAGSIKYVLSSGVWTEFGLNLGSATILGDYKYLVKVVGSIGSILQSAEGASPIFENIDFKNCTIGNGFRNVNFINCHLESVVLNISSLSSFPVFNNCNLLNATIDNASDSPLNPTFIDFSISILKNVSINSTALVRELPGGLKFRSCYVDEASSFLIRDETVLFEIQNSNFRGTITNINSADLSVVEEINRIDVDPLFNNEEGGDYTLAPNSPHILSGVGSVNIGGTEVSSNPLYQGQSILDNAVATNSNIEYSPLGELQNNTSQIQYITFPEVETNAIEYLGKWIPSGFGDNNKVRLFIDWAMNDGVFQGFKEFRWGMEPTLDDSGNSNAEDAYRWSVNNLIPAKKYIVKLEFDPS